MKRRARMPYGLWTADDHRRAAAADLRQEQQAVVDAVKGFHHAMATAHLNLSREKFSAAQKSLQLALNWVRRRARDFIPLYERANDLLTYVETMLRRVEASLRQRTIRLAATHSTLRPYLLPLLRA
jgi:hypothetical protein